MDISFLAGVPRQNQPEERRASDNGINIPPAPRGTQLSRELEAYPTYLENGRWYHGYRRGQYMFPCDEPEQDRLDLFHKMLRVARHEKLHLAPINIPNPVTMGDAGPRVLDLGCGTGIWAMDMARAYPKAEVFGIDLAPIQPVNPPSNCAFYSPRDYESPWLLGEGSWDFIHLQMGCGSVTDWKNVYNKVINHLRPGTGYFEQVEIDFDMRTHGFTLAPNNPLAIWYQLLREATEAGRRPIAFDLRTSQYLEHAGFVDITHNTITLPLSMWGTDPDSMEVGKWYSLAFSESALTLLWAPLIRMKNMSIDDIRNLAQQAKVEAYKKDIRAYNVLHIYTARRPT
ncbi:LaeA protein [Uncinocarpus reesii 1704]|uniref:Velvet complex subunit laeA n=1 Tax=Uncinocarpus reesii (strain UAMH 1704) TaxID=336963 RepID=C4JY46_UNCRE|nr:LaeA protein [Uncinocarpus reesii 1704]EEP82232.1 LaeA protein [Uncinocarpus reesii 1704]